VACVTDRERLRATFDEDADRYDRVRPGYPPALFDDLAAWADLRPGSRVLEIGAGTGQATRDLAARGYRVTAVELGPELAERARRNLAGFPDTEVVTADFDRWTPPHRYDAVVAATAFHWLDPATRAARTAAALADGGALAVVATEHVAGGSDAFFDEVQRCYERWDPATPPGLRLLPASAFSADLPDIASSGRFGPVHTGRYESTLRYSTAEYLDVLDTYSGHRALPRADHDGLFAGIADLIDTRHGGHVAKNHLRMLSVFPRL
jgi:protein-L-isoaspartate O-methyltransferase